MDKQDQPYLLARAEEELEIARRSLDPKAVSSHYRLAELYLDSVYGNSEPDGEAES